MYGRFKTLIPDLLLPFYIFQKTRMNDLSVLIIDTDSQFRFFLRVFI